MKTLYVVRVEVDPSRAAEWADWMDRDHIPAVLRCRGFVSGARCLAGEAPDGWRRFVNLYELDSMASLEAYFVGEESRRLRADHSARFGAQTRVEREAWELQFETAREQ